MSGQKKTVAPIRRTVEVHCRFWSVANRTVHGWKADGVDLTNAEAVVEYLRRRRIRVKEIDSLLEKPDVVERLAEQLAELPQVDEVAVSIRDKKTLKEVELLEIKIATAKGELVERELIREVGQRIGALIVAELAAVANDAPGQLAGANEATIRERLEARFVTLVNRLRESIAEVDSVGVE